ncbi:hypothetical protein UA32_12205 [Photobacterium angustum]|uniref:Chromosome segregation ATPase n=1 Tax=Photobacterium angustum TaxID=661 RepID=A0ABX5GYK7_PHOAN|nr:hypothetical protein [Photobacterium angustum]KJG37717.1 hypothetical protein UA32_12205 [Photobacterium angustum]PSX03950.1 hypothetical protein C0W27_20875 [Photobacterium angustum]
MLDDKIGQLKTACDAKLNVTKQYIESNRNDIAIHSLVAVNDSLSAVWALFSDLNSELQTLSNENTHKALLLNEEANRHNDLKKESGDLNSEVEKLNRQLSALNGRYSNLEKKKKELASDNRKLRSLNAEDLASKLEKLKSKSKKEKEDFTNIIKNLRGEIELLNKDISAQKRMLVDYNGRTLINSVMGQGNKHSYSLIYFHNAKTYRNVDARDGVSVVAELPWSLQVSCSNGISIDVAFTEFGSPLYPICSDFTEDFPKNMSELIHKEYLALLKKSPPHLKINLEMINQFKQLTATTLHDVDEIEKISLQKAKLIMIYDSIALNKSNFTSKVTSEGLIDEIQACALYDKLVNHAVDFRKKFLIELAEMVKESA